MASSPVWKKMVLDGLFSSVLDEKIQVNKVFPTYQMWMKRDPKFEKFYSVPLRRLVNCLQSWCFHQNSRNADQRSISPLSSKMHDWFGAVIGDALKLDWVDTRCTYMD